MKEVARKEINEEREKKLFLENFNIEIRKLFYFIVYLIGTTYTKKKTDGYARPLRFRSNRKDVSYQASN